MSSTDLLFKKIQRHIGELAPSHQNYVSAIQTPESNTHIFTTLIEDGTLDADIIAEAMARAKGAEVARPDDIDPAEAKIFGRGRDGVIVYRKVAYMVNPYDSVRMRDLQHRVENGEIEYVKSGVISITTFNDPRFMTNSEVANASNDDDDNSSGESNKIKAESMINKIIQDAFMRKATDIHISGNSKHGDVRVRLDGKIRPLLTFDIDLYENLSTVLHEKTNTQIQDPHRSHSADFEFKTMDGQTLTLRLESIPHQSGRKTYRKIALRILGIGASFGSLKNMGFTERNLSRVMSVTRRPGGLFLVTGPTGSGKSTTLGTMMSTMYTSAPDKAYYSLEHPVETEYKGIWQVPIQGSLTFEEALESAMRLDPDVIMVGEIRSQKTAELAIQGALTGHVVLATLHTKDSHGIVPRLQHFGISPVDLAEALIGSSGQRLVPKLCQKCSVKKSFGDVKADLRHDLPSLEFIRPEWIPDEHEIGVMNPKGCDHCQHSGISGREQVFECFLSDASVRDQLLKSTTGIELRLQAIRNNAIETLWQDAIRLLKQGKVCVEEVFKTLDESDLQDLANLSHNEPSSI